MINVLSLVTFKVFPPQMGGQKGVALFYKYLQKHVHLTIASSSNNKNNDFEIEEILYPNKAIYLNLFSIAKLKKIINQKHIDVIIVEHSYPAWIAYLLHKKTGIPFIIHSHNIEAYRFKQMKKWWWKWYNKYESWIHKKAAFNFFISKEDQDFAIKYFGIDPVKTSIVPYGIIPNKNDNKSKSELKKELELPVDQYIFLFNGTLNYQPNIEAINFLIKDIVPLLKQHLSNFKIVICGRDVETDLAEKINEDPNFILKGFVNDIDSYYKAANLFLNPVINNSGVKTKVVEALANNCTTISFRSGSTGIPVELCNEKLVIINDKDWKSFSEAILLNKDSTAITSTSFYNYFDWNNIAAKAFEAIQQVVNKK